MLIYCPACVALIMKDPDFFCVALIIKDPGSFYVALIIKSPSFFCVALIIKEPDFFCAVMLNHRNCIFTVLEAGNTYAITTFCPHIMTGVDDAMLANQH
eukprot:215231-Pelagomonas_calceolata.AAC.2